jgi:hypothetical protein
MTSPDAAHEPSATAPDAPAPVTREAGAGGAAGGGGAAGAGGAASRVPVPPEQSREDTDAAWGEYATRDDDRLYRDRPPHWDDV